MDIEKYITSQPYKRQERLFAIIQRIKRLYPQCAVSIKYKMPTFETRTGSMSLASQKSYLSVYTLDEDYISGFRKKHRKIKAGIGCLSFKDSDVLPLDDLEEVIINALGA